MIDFREVLGQVSLEGTGLDQARVRALLKQLERAAGSGYLDFGNSELDHLKEKFRCSLEAEGAAAATVRNQVCRLGKLLKAAEDQQLISPRVVFDPGFPMPTPPLKEGPARRRYVALGHFRRWCVGERIPFTSVTTETIRKYREHLRSPNIHRGVARAEVLYSDLLAAYREQEGTGRFHRIDLPRWKDESATQYGLPRRDWPPQIEADFARLERGALNRPLPAEKRWTVPLRPVSLHVFQCELERLLGYAKNVRGLNIEGARLSEIVGEESVVLGFIQWHRDERCAGQERKYHAAWLNRFGAIHTWLTGDGSTATRFSTVSASLKRRRVRDPFPARPIDYAEFTEASVRAIEAALKRWHSLTEASGPGPRIEAACALRDAVCLGVLVARPMRSENIRNMKLAENLAKSADGTWRLKFADHEMKTRTYSCEFPREISAALEVYLAEARPTLAGNPAEGNVFPSKSGRTLRAPDLWRRMTAIGSAYLSIRTNPHLFRYLVPCAYILRHPDRLIEMQALLGHSNLAVTLRCYVRVYSQIASRRVAELQRAHCPSMRRLGELLPP